MALVPEIMNPRPFGQIRSDLSRRQFRLVVALGMLALVLFVGCAPRAERPAEKITPPAAERELDEAERREAYAALSSARGHYEAGRLREALAAFQRVRERYPDSAIADDALYSIGRIRFEQGDPTGAVAALQRLLETYPSSDLIDETRFWLGRALLGAGRAEDAVTVLGDLAAVRDLEPTRKAAVAELLGQAHGAMGEPAKAVRWLMAALAGYESESAKAAELRNGISEIILGAEDRKTVENLARRYTGEFPGGVAEFRLIELLIAADAFGAAYEEIGRYLESYGVEDPYYTEVTKRLAVLEAARTVNSRKIGVLLPLSGRGARVGEQVLRGLELALNDGSPESAGIEIVVRDTAGNPARTHKAVEELALEEKVVAIVGPLFAATAEEAARRAEELRVPLLALSQREGLGRTGEWVFRYFMTPRDQIRSIVRHAMEERGLRTFGVLYPGNEFGKYFSRLFWEEVERRGGWVTAAGSYEPDSTDFKAEMLKMTGRWHRDARSYEREVLQAKAGSAWEPNRLKLIEYSYKLRFDPPGTRKELIKLWKEISGEDEEQPLSPRIDFDAIFVPDSHKTATLVAPQLDYNDLIGTDLLGIHLWNDERLTKYGEKYVEGALFADGFFAGATDPLVREFVSRYADVYGAQPGIFEAAGYDAFRLVRHALNNPEKKKLLRTEVQARLLATRDLALLMGPAEFDAEGEAQLRPTLLTVANRKITEVALPKQREEGAAPTGVPES